MYLGQAGSVRSLRLHIRDVAAEALKLLHRRVKRHDPLRGGRRRVGRHPLSRAGPVRSDPETRHTLFRAGELDLKDLRIWWNSS